MNWIAIVKLLLDNAPEIIQTVGDGLDWTKQVWEDWKKTTGRDEASVTNDELIAHIAHFTRSSDVIQNIP